jgi:hypothetical protein
MDKENPAMLGLSFVSTYESRQRRVDVVEFPSIVRTLRADPIRRQSGKVNIQ